jgi:hypothetical protein
MATQIVWIEFFDDKGRELVRRATGVLPADERAFMLSREALDHASARDAIAGDLTIRDPGWKDHCRIRVP